MYDHILMAVQQSDLELARQRDEAHRRAEEAIRAQHRAAGRLNISDVQAWMDNQTERDAEQKRPTQKEQADVDVSRPSSSSRFPPPPRRA